MTAGTAHLVRIPGTDWQVWRTALLRTTGFGVDGLDLLAAPTCAASADAHLDDAETRDAFVEAYTAAAHECGRVACEIAADPRFREAITWQNTNALYALDGLVKGGPDGRRNAKRRIREEVVARYWQRYCAKNETIGFFGPIDWVTLDPEAPPVTLRTGPGVVRDRFVFFEYRAVAAYAEVLATDPVVRPWLPVGLAPQLTIAGRQVRRPTQAPLPLSKVEAAVLARCDGQRSAVEVARDACADPALGLRKEADVYLVLDRMVEQQVLHWGLDLPQHPRAEQVLAAGIDAIADDAARKLARSGFDRLVAARDAVAAAAGDPIALAAALARLDEEFVAVTGGETRHRSGQMYAGRALCYEDTTRDLDVVFGGAVLDAIAEPMAVLLQAARWLTAALADVYTGALRELYADLAADLPATASTDPTREPHGVPLGELWFLAQGMLFGGGERPVDGVAAEFARRWAGLFGLDRLVPGQSRLTVSAAELAAQVDEVFPADRPGWSAARTHSPDLHICAPDVDAVGRGEFTVVMGEMHTAWPTFDNSAFLPGHPAPEELRDALAADRGPGQVLPLFPVDWPRYTGRVCRALDNDTDVDLAFVAAPGADRSRLLPVTAAIVVETDGDLWASVPDGRRWPLIEVFAGLVAMHAVDGFKLVAAAGHCPRITIDRLVVARETWRTTVGGTGLADKAPHPDRYLTARRWRRSLGLPERVYVKIGTETKPCYVDFSSPLYVGSLAAMLRAAHLSGGPDVPVVVSEMLPDPDDAWVPDGTGQRYFSELRLQFRDPRPAWPWPGAHPIS